MNYSARMHNFVFTKKFFFGLLIFGIVASAAGAGTFATFNATTTNPGNTFASGTLVLSNTSPNVSGCLSTSTGVATDTNTHSCGAAFNFTNLEPTSTKTVQMTINNAGTLAASSFKFYSASCADSETGTYHGTTGDICGDIQVYIQQTDSTFLTTSPHALACLYGTNTANVCSFNSSDTLAGLATTSGATSSGSGSLTSYAGGDSASSHGFTINGDGTNPGLTAGGSSYFIIGLKMTDNGAGADNQYQGLTATNEIDWTINQ